MPGKREEGEGRGEDEEGEEGEEEGAGGRGAMMADAAKRALLESEEAKDGDSPVSVNTATDLPSSPADSLGNDNFHHRGGAMAAEAGAGASPVRGPQPAGSGPTKGLGASHKAAQGAAGTKGAGDTISKLRSM